MGALGSLTALHTSVVFLGKWVNTVPVAGLSGWGTGGGATSGVGAAGPSLAQPARPAAAMRARSSLAGRVVFENLVMCTSFVGPAHPVRARSQGTRAVRERDA